MGKLERIKRIFGKTGATIASVAKVALMSRIPTGKGDSKSETLIILANGPSLRDALDNHMPLLKKHPLLTVNFSPNTPEFFELQPKIHVLADDLFFEREKKGNIEQLWDNLAKVDWQMVLYVPVTKKRCADLKRLPANVEIKYFNLTPVDGFGFIKNWLYSAGLGMPRPRNVLIPSIMNGVREGYRDIVLTGADHSWSRTLWVDDDNHVVTVQPHFYKDNDKEKKRVDTLYQNIHLHQIYESFSIAFRSYFAVKEYCDRKGVKVLNATPGSFIDAFPRISLDEVK